MTNWFELSSLNWSNDKSYTPRTFSLCATIETTLRLFEFIDIQYKEDRIHKFQLVWTTK